jgi:hypothetical protein
MGQICIKNIPIFFFHVQYSMLTGRNMMQICFAHFFKFSVLYSVHIIQKRLTKTSQFEKKIPTWSWLLISGLPTIRKVIACYHLLSSDKKRWSNKFSSGLKNFEAK